MRFIRQNAGESELGGASEPPFRALSVAQPQFCSHFARTGGAASRNRNFAASSRVPGVAAREAPAPQPEPARRATRNFAATSRAPGLQAERRGGLGRRKGQGWRTRSCRRPRAWACRRPDAWATYDSLTTAVPSRMITLPARGKAGMSAASSSLTVTDSPFDTMLMGQPRTYSKYCCS